MFIATTEITLLVLNEERKRAKRMARAGVGMPVELMPGAIYRARNGGGACVITIRVLIFPIHIPFLSFLEKIYVEK